MDYSYMASSATGCKNDCFDGVAVSLENMQQENLSHLLQISLNGTQQIGEASSAHANDQVARYVTATLTADAVPARLLPPPATALDGHLVAGFPALEPYVRLFHRNYAIATPSATERLRLGVLEAPPSWAPNAPDAAVQLVELRRAAGEYASGMRELDASAFLTSNRDHNVYGTGVAADAVAPLLF